MERGEEGARSYGTRKNYPELLPRNSGLEQEGAATTQRFFPTFSEESASGEAFRVYPLSMVASGRK